MPLTYDVIYYCDVLPIFEVKASGLSLEQAESKVKEYENRKKGDSTKMLCCRYFIQTSS